MRTLLTQINNGIKRKLMSTDRLNRLLLAEDWKRVYPSHIKTQNLKVTILILYVEQ